jgi:hypothetical protein
MHLLVEQNLSMWIVIGAFIILGTDLALFDFMGWRIDLGALG